MFCGSVCADANHVPGQERMEAKMKKVYSGGSLYFQECVLMMQRIHYTEEKVIMVIRRRWKQRHMHKTNSVQAAGQDAILFPFTFVARCCPYAAFSVFSALCMNQWTGAPEDVHKSFPQF